MVTPDLDLSRLKHAVTIEQVLADKGLLGRLRTRGNRLTGACPLHGGDNPTAFVADLDKRAWHCFTACSAGGDVVELARRLEGGSYLAAARYLARLAASAPAQPAPPPLTAPPRAFRPFTRRLHLDPHTDFLARKQITPTTARRFEVGLYRGRGMLSGCIAVRLADPQGKPLGYAGRRIDPAEATARGKWVFPPALPKSSLLYGYHHARRPTARAIVVVECPWGVLRLAQLGVPAVALLGSQLSAPQRALLATVPALTLLLDADPTGRAAARAIARKLPQSTVVNLPDGLDPDDLPDSALSLALRQSFPLPS